MTGRWEDDPVLERLRAALQPPDYAMAAWLTAPGNQQAAEQLQRLLADLRARS